MSARHTSNWTVAYTATTPDGKTFQGLAWGRTRKDAREKARQHHVDAPFGTRVQTTVPVKVVTL